MQYSLVQCIQCEKKLQWADWDEIPLQPSPFWAINDYLSFITSHAYNIYLSTSHRGVEKFDERFVSMFGRYTPPY